MPGYSRGDGTKATYEDITQEELFDLCTKRRKVVEASRVSTFIAKKHIAWKIPRHFLLL